MRQRIDYAPYADYILDEKQPPWELTGQWPCKWIIPTVGAAQPYACGYRCKFEIENDMEVRLHVTADERYILYFDGQFEGRGSERGNPSNWFYETYDIKMKAGTHVLTALVWAMETLRPAAQTSVSPGFILMPDSRDQISLLGTGNADWEYKIVEGLEFINEGSPGWAPITGARTKVNGFKYPWGIEKGEGEGWQKASPGEYGVSGNVTYHMLPDSHVLRPAILPPMMEEKVLQGVVRHIDKSPVLHGLSQPFYQKDNMQAEIAVWANLLKGNSITIPANTVRRVLIDLENYYCAYHAIRLSGGAGSSVSIGWAERVFDQAENGNIAFTDSNRDDIEGKVFSGKSDTFITDGGMDRKFNGLWWLSGRYVELTVTTLSTPLVIESLEFYETRYPLSIESNFKCSEKNLTEIYPSLTRTLQMCSHETYMDCPFWEQLMYIADTRNEIQQTYVISRDNRLPLKAIEMFAKTRENHTGIIMSSFPDGKIIPSFCLWWVAAVHDYTFWRGDVKWLKEMMPAVRNVLDLYLQNINEDGLLITPKGWNYFDTAFIPDGKWKYAVPPEEGKGINSLFNWQMVMVLAMASQLEEYLDEPELSSRYTRLADRLVKAIDRTFWNDSKGLYSDDILGKNYSEHAQCLAVLSGWCCKEKQDSISRHLAVSKDIARADIFFTHYVFGTYYKLGMYEAFYNRLTRWYELPLSGFKTTPESFGATRSDCHAWSSHPLYHCYATILGIRPAVIGFKKLNISPMLGEMEWAEGEMVHPNGTVKAQYRRHGEKLKVKIVLPEGISGQFTWRDKVLPLQSGEQSFEV